MTTDRTFHSLHRLHRIFAGCSVLLLIVTIWLVVADHRREWKRLQRASDRIDRTMAQWRQWELATVAATGERARCEEALRELESREFPPELLARFRAAVESDAARRGADAPAWGDLDAAVARLTAAAAAAQAARDAWQAVRRDVDPARGDGEDAGDLPDPLPPRARSARDAAARQPASQALQVRRQAEKGVLPPRRAVLALLHARVDGARFREELLERRRRLEQGWQDVAQSRYALAVRDGQPADTRRGLDAAIRQREERLERYAREIEVASQHRAQLQSLVEQMQAPQTEEQKRLDLLLAESWRVHALAESRRSTFVTFRGWLPLPGKRWLELPILDAFNSPRKITNLWCEGLDQPLGSFGRVRRFDRCVTCHTAIATAAPDAPDAPRLGPLQTLELALDVSAAGLSAPRTPPGAPTTPADLLLETCGLQIAPEGLINPHDATVMLVRPASPAARARPWRDVGAAARGRDVRNRALQTLQEDTPQPTVSGLRAGDVIVAIDDQSPPPDATGSQWVMRQLLAAAAERRQRGGDADPPTPIRVTVRRGLPHPYAGHPRLDLFVGPDSPHPMSSFGCTVCHEGQGSATSFRWAAHTPNDPESRQRWTASRDWSSSSDWDFPMLPRRFAESRCLRCHPQVLALAPSPRFPDSPAPTLLTGYHLVRRLGCFGCHEINGYDDAARQIAPDLRPEPNRDAQPTAAAAPGADSRPPGTMRKVGPSLRHVAAKLDRTFLVDWIRNPRTFRPDTTMPRAFGLWNHLPDQERRDDVEARREALAVYSVATYLRERSLPFTHVDPPRDISPVTTPAAQQAQIARGRIAFEESGCLVCHSHAGFPDFAPFRDADAMHLGPDLTRTAAKFAAARNPGGTRWLYDWIQDPARHDPRTTMPSMQYSRVERRDAEGRVVATTDPVADIVAYLMSHPADDWTPAADAAADADERLSPARLLALEEMTLTYLRDATSPTTAEQFARRGIPAEWRERWQGPEQELVVEMMGGPPLSEGEWTRRRLFYVARKTLLANGCAACHDIPGLEAARPIGPALTGWGRKNPAELSFGHALQYVQPESGAHPAAAAPPRPYYLDELRAQSRIGFVYQKLAEPRSFDYLATDHKKYTARLHMPQFTLTPHEREAIATFVLGLVSDPPSPRFTYRPDPQTAARIAGEDLLHTFQCRGCHVLEAASWELAFAPGTFGQPRQAPPHPFVPRGVDARALAASTAVDRHGWRRAVLYGMPKLADDGRAEILDAGGDELARLEDEMFPLEQLTHSFQLWRPAALDGWPHPVDGSALAIETRHIQRRRPPVGGALARYLLPRLVARERARNPNVRGSQAWTWLPPPLSGEGTKVQPDWLQRYLQDPQPIRPAVAMRMPHYHLSSAAARTLVDYFAARDGAPGPYPDMPERAERHLQLAAAAYADRLAAARSDAPAAEGQRAAARTRLGDALRVVASSDYCIRCHRVGRDGPDRGNHAQAPDLADVYERLRAEYLRTWLAHPAAVLPSTPMPVNIPYDPTKPLLGSTLSQDLLRGDTLEQLQALVDLLLNFDREAIARTNAAP